MSLTDQQFETTISVLKAEAERHRAIAADEDVMHTQRYQARIAAADADDLAKQLKTRRPHHIWTIVSVVTALHALRNAEMPHIGKFELTVIADELENESFGMRSQA